MNLAYTKHLIFFVTNLAILPLQQICKISNMLCSEFSNCKTFSVLCNEFSSYKIFKMLYNEFSNGKIFNVLCNEFNSYKISNMRCKNLIAAKHLICIIINSETRNILLICFAIN